MFDFSEYFIGFVKETILNERPVFSEYVEDFDSLIDYAVTSFYEKYSAEMNEEYSSRRDEVVELREEYAEVLLDDFLNIEELRDSLYSNCDLSLPYTDDVFSFYRENMAACDDAVADLGGADQYGSISSALYYAVGYVRECQAMEELEAYLEAIHIVLTR